MTGKDDEFTIDALLERIEEFQNRTQLERIHRLNRENDILKEDIKRHKIARKKTATLLKEAFEAMKFLQSALERYGLETTITEKEWLLFWGIYDGLVLEQS